jgi:2-polyprenyl-6-methoxyphenol hydroxylase-like FAD-dependent oxidoreductase
VPALASARHVIVAGAGIAGLTAALALARVGFRVSVLEQADKLEEVGAGIQLGPNATRALIALGLRETLLASAVVPQAIRVMAGGSGREVVRIPLGESVERCYGAPYWAIHRGDLQAALANAARAHPDIALKLATRVEDFAVHERGITVQARAAGQVVDERGIALIGADGLWSALRARLGRQRPPRFAHRTAWRALVPAETVAPAFRQPQVHLWLGLDAHLVHYPVKGGRLINIVGIVHDDWKDTGWNAAGERADILRHFARWAWDESARDLIATPEHWLKWALYERRHPFRGGRGPVTLIGDAAHPMLPFLAQGAGMAIEDAAVLAHMLANYGDDVADALRAYEGARRLRTMRAQRESRRQARIYGLSGPEGLVRNLVMRASGGERLLSRYDWLYSWRAPDPIPMVSHLT